MIDEIRNCVITQQTSKILKPFIDSEDEEEYKQYKEYHTGVDIECNGYVSSISFGEVIFIGHTGNTYNVVIQDEDGSGYNYAHLSSQPEVELYDEVSSGQLIGTANKYVHFEYLYKVPNEFPLRVGDITLYRYDPEFILEDNLLLNSETELANLRLQNQDNYEELMVDYYDDMEDRIEDDDANPPEPTGYDGDDEPDDYGSEDTGYPEGYSMPLEDIVQSADL